MFRMSHDWPGLCLYTLSASVENKKSCVSPSLLYGELSGLVRSVEIENPTVLSAGASHRFPLARGGYTRVGVVSGHMLISININVITHLEGPDE